MLRKAFRMTLLPARKAEYIRRHNPIWPELEAVLHTHGASNYSIFLDDSTNDLFAYVEIESEERWAAIARTDVCRRWWKMMQDIMETNENDGSPASVDLSEVFHME